MVVDVLRQGAAKGHVENLNAPTNRQRGEVAIDRRATQFDVGGVALRLRVPRIRRPFGAVTRRVHIGTAGEHKAVDPVEQFTDFIQLDDGQNNRNSTSLAHGPHVGRGHDIVPHSIATNIQNFLVGSNANYRGHPGTLPRMWHPVCSVPLMKFDPHHALITGASAGIGEAIAHELASRGVGLTLVARRADKLEALATEIRTKHKVAVEVLAADLTSAEGLAMVEDRLGSTSAPIDMVVNNAGFGTTGKFVNSVIDDEEREIRLNVIAVTRLTKAAIGPMVERNRGWIANVSSLGSFQSGPGMATYCATKAYVTSFTEAIAEELRGTNVRATAVCPGFTTTEFQAVANQGEEAINNLPGFAIMNSAEVAKSAINQIARGRVIAITGMTNHVLGISSRLMPRAVSRRVAASFMKNVT